jgi:hypothetical protein
MPDEAPVTRATLRVEFEEVMKFVAFRGSSADGQEILWTQAGRVTSRSRQVAWHLRQSSRAMLIKALIESKRGLGRVVVLRIQQFDRNFLLPKAHRGGLRSYAISPSMCTRDPYVGSSSLKRLVASSSITATWC